MCTHTTTHHTPCLCVLTRTTTPCTDSEGAGYRGSICPAFEHVQLFISAADPSHCSHHLERGESGDQCEAGSMSDSPKRKAGLDVGVKSGAVKETIKKIDGISGQEDKLLESIGELSDELNHTELSPQRKFLNIAEHGTAKKDPSPQTPPQQHLGERGTDLRVGGGADSTSRDSSDSDSDDGFLYRGSLSKHNSRSQSRSSSSSSDPFYIKTPKSSSTLSITQQESFSQDGDVIYGGTSILNVPIDGTKWNWNGIQWIGTRAVPAASRQHEMELQAFNA